MTAPPLNLSVPSVYIEANFEFPCWQVYSDKSRAMEEAFDYLHQLGHTEIFCLWKNLPDEQLESGPRFQGIKPRTGEVCTRWNC
jgi:DNA-binding LacI/PurR family transcriptional regulator